MNKIEKKRPGRPRKNPMNKVSANLINLRLSDEDVWKLGYITVKWGVTRSDALRHALDILYDMAKWQNKPKNW